MPAIDIIDHTHEPQRSLGGLPYSVVASLTLDEPAHLQDDQRPLAKKLREMIRKQAISRLDLVEQMGRTRGSKSLRLLDSAVRGKSTDEPLFRHAFESMGVSKEAFAEILNEENRFSTLRHQEASRRSAHRSFKMLGPHLTAILLRGFENSRPRIWAPYRDFCAKVFYECDGDAIIPLTAQAVATAIHHDVKWLPAVSKRYVHAYIYQRMPEEAYVIDPCGNILAAGDWRYSLSDRVIEFLYPDKNETA